MSPKCSKVTLLAGLCTLTLLSYSPQLHAAGERNLPAAVQQTKKVTGTVSDSQGPIIGATVRVKGTQNATVTDMDGNYSLNVPQGATLEFSYIGYVNKEIKVGAASTYDITLSEDNQSLDEVVVVGYGTMKKSDISGASVSLGEKDVKGSIITSLDQSLQGRAAGVTAVSTSGAPGTSTSIRVRGQATINANAEPLYVIDGVIVQSSGSSGASLGLGDALGNGATSTISPLSTINPADIVSMEILKDASATAIYGAQGANGVVLITTKHGRAGEAKFTYDGMMAWNRQTKRLDIMNLREYAQFYNDFVETGQVANPSEYYSDPSLLGKGTNWQDAVFQTAFQHQHQLSAQGGSDKVQYYTSVGYMDQEGTIVGSAFNRISFRTNLNAELKKWLKMGVNIAYTHTHDYLTLADSDEGVINYSLLTAPDIPIYNIEGGYSTIVREGYSNPNPIALALLNDIKLRRQKLNGNIYFDVSPIKHITWHTEFGFDLGWNKGETYEPMVDLGGWSRASNESRISNSKNTYWSAKNYITYANQFGDHSVTAMVGQEAWESKWENTSIYNTGLPSDEVHNPQLGSGDPQITAGWGSAAMASFFTRLTYGYKGKYNGTYTYRYDGSSNFGPDKRWAGFHSFAASWRFSEEKFVRDFAGKWLSNGKLRLGWGQTGNSSIGGYKWGTTISIMNSNLGSGYRPANIPNTAIQWESQEQWNVGLDLGFLNDRINATIDWYRKESKDMLMPLQLPSYMGTSGNASSALAAPWGNYGTIRNTGYEITITTHPLIGQFQWDSEVQFTRNKNKLVALSGTANAAIVGYGQWSDVVSMSNVGESLYSFYGYKTDGIYKDLADLQNSPKPVKYPADGVFNRSNTVWVGDVKYKDLSGPEGKPDGVIDDYDLTNIGSPLPKFTWGWTNTFRYKNFDLSIFINGSVGNKVFNYMKMKLTHMNSLWSNQLVDVLGRSILEPIDPNVVYDDGSHWYDHVENVRVSNPSATLPRATIADANDNDRISDRYIESGTYLRMKNISLGYTFPKKLVSRFGIDNLRVYCNIQNLFTITPYDGYDPEIGVSTASLNVYGLDNGRYPSPTTYSFGLNLTF